jgi:hypothetical protein
MTALLEPWKEKAPTESEEKMLQGDSQLIIVAGRYVVIYWFECPRTYTDPA